LIKLQFKMAYKLKIESEGHESYVDYIKENSKEKVYQIVEVWMKTEKVETCTYSVSEDVALDNVNSFNGGM